MQQLDRVQTDGAQVRLTYDDTGTTGTASRVREERYLSTAADGSPETLDEIRETWLDGRGLVWRESSTPGNGAWDVTELRRDVLRELQRELRAAGRRAVRGDVRWPLRRGVRDLRLRGR